MQGRPLTESATKSYYIRRYLAREDRWSRREEAREVSATVETAIRSVSEARLSVAVLDIGCGLMPVSLPLVERFPSLTVLGIDWALGEILRSYPEFKARTEATGRVRVVESDFFFFECNSKFDVALDLGTFHHVTSQDWGAYLSKLLSVLRDDGHFFLETFHPDDGNWRKPESGGHIRKDYYCHYHDLRSVQCIFGSVFPAVREVARFSHWEHVIALYHLGRKDR